LSDLVARLEIPPLSTYGVTAGDIPEIAAKAAKTSSMKANPIVLTDEELREIATLAL
jgi:alcohol dehydrogenase class IV